MALEEREEGRGRVRQHCTTELPVSAGNLLSNASLFAPEPAPADELRVRSAPTAPRPVPGWGSHPSDQAPAGSESTSQQEAEFTGAVLQAELRQAQTFVLSLPYAGIASGGIPVWRGISCLPGRRHLLCRMIHGHSHERMYFLFGTGL
jgi:hypothetical protein